MNHRCATTIVSQVFAEPSEKKKILFIWHDRFFALPLLHKSKTLFSVRQSCWALRKSPSSSCTKEKQTTKSSSCILRHETKSGGLQTSRLYIYSFHRHITCQYFLKGFFFRLTKLKATTEASSLSPSDLQLIESGCASVLALKIPPKKKSLLAIRLLRLLLLLLLRSTTMTKDCRVGSAVSFCGRLDRYDLWKIHYLISSIQVVDSCEKKKKSLFPV